MPLNFNALRQANILRLPQFKNRRGGPAHSEPDGSDWKLSAWSNAVLGELGELANLIKKIERGDFGPEDDDVMSAVADELADVQTYLDILAFRCGVDLGEATISKFNRISERVHSSVRLAYDNPVCLKCRGRGWFTLDMMGETIVTCDHKPEK